MITNLERAMNKAWAKFKTDKSYCAKLAEEPGTKSGMLFLAHCEGFLAGANWYKMNREKKEEER